MNWTDFSFGWLLGFGISYVLHRYQLYVVWREARIMMLAFKRITDQSFKAVKQLGVDEAIASGAVVPAPSVTQPEETFK